MKRKVEKNKVEDCKSQVSLNYKLSIMLFKKKNQWNK